MENNQGRKPGELTLRIDNALSRGQYPSEIAARLDGSSRDAEMSKKR